MAPILSSSIGITQQVIDDEKLRNLRSSLEELKIKGPLNPEFDASDKMQVPLDIEHLVVLLEPWQSWTFEEQVSMMFLLSLRECIRLLERMLTWNFRWMSVG
jgi:hypothetical protein